MINYVNGIPGKDYLEIIRKTEEAVEKRINEYNKRGMYVTETMKNTWYRMYNTKFEKEYQETHREVSKWVKTNI